MGLFFVYQVDQKLLTSMLFILAGSIFNLSISYSSKSHFELSKLLFFEVDDVTTPIAFLKKPAFVA